MSADNWTICPKCHEEHEKKLIEFDDQVTKAYGKVPPDEYERLRKERAQLETQAEPETLREDYEQGILEGEYYLRYSGHCNVCGFDFQKSIDEQVWPSKSGKAKH